MLEFIRLATIPLTVVLIVVLIRLLFRAPKVIPNLSRSGFSLGTWLTGKGLKDDAGSTIRTGHGLSVRIERDAQGKKERAVVDETINLSGGRL